MSLCGSRVLRLWSAASRALVLLPKIPCMSRRIEIKTRSEQAAGDSVSSGRVTGPYKKGYPHPPIPPPPHWVYSCSKNLRAQESAQDCRRLRRPVNEAAEERAHPAASAYTASPYTSQIPTNTCIQRHNCSTWNNCVRQHTGPRSRCLNEASQKLFHVEQFEIFDSFSHLASTAGRSLWVALVPHVMRGIDGNSGDAVVPAFAGVSGETGAE
jgi:hypothetical protein